MEAHIYARGGHAFNLGSRSRLTSLQNWPERAIDWMADNYILDPLLRTEEERREQEAAERNRQERLARLKEREAARRQRIESATATYSPVGTWTWERRFGDQTMKYHLTITKQDGQVNGNYETQRGGDSSPAVPLEEVVLEANELSFKVSPEFNGRPFTISYHGTIAEDSITGFYEMNFGGQLREVEWTATRTANTENPRNQ